MIPFDAKRKIMFLRKFMFAVGVKRSTCNTIIRLSVCIGVTIGYSILAIKNFLIGALIGMVLMLIWFAF